MVVSGLLTMRDGLLVGGIYEHSNMLGPILGIEAEIRGDSSGPPCRAGRMSTQDRMGATLQLGTPPNESLQKTASAPN